MEKEGHYNTAFIENIKMFGTVYHKDKGHCQHEEHCKTELNVKFRGIFLTKLPRRGIKVDHFEAFAVF